MPGRHRNFRFCRIQRVSGQAGSGHRRPGRSLASSTGTRVGPATSGPVAPRRVGGGHRATSIVSITLSDRGRSGRTLAEPPFGVAVGWSLVRTLAAQIRALGRLKAVTEEVAGPPSGLPDGAGGWWILRRRQAATLALARRPG